MTDTAINVSEDVKVVKIPMDNIKPNDWNPNQLSDQMFNRLTEDIQNIGFLQPILVTPVGDGTYRIIDGEHRYECAKLLDMEEAPCVVVEGDFAEDEVKQKFQTMRMNMIRGNVDKRKLTALVQDLATTMPLEDVAEGMAYDDVDGLRALIEDARSSLPVEMRKEFDKARDEIKTVEDLSLVLNRLFAKYGSTIPYHYMIMDFGGKEHIWVRLSGGRQLTEVRGYANLARDKQITFSSLVLHALSQCATSEYIDAHLDAFAPADDVDDDANAVDESDYLSAVTATEDTHVTAD